MRILPGVRLALCIILTLSACSGQPEETTEPGCVAWRQCGAAADGELCGTCDDGIACTDDRCLDGYLCGAARTRDSCECRRHCREDGVLLRVAAAVNGDGGIPGLRGILDMAATPDGRHIYTLSRASRGTRALAGEQDEAEPMHDTADGHPPAGPHGEGRLNLIWQRDGKLYQRASWESDGGLSVAVTPDGTRLIGGTVDFTAVYPLDPSTGAPDLGHRMTVPNPASALVTADERVVAATGDTLILYQLEGMTLTELSRVTDPRLAGAHRLAVSPDGAHVYALSFSGSSLTGWTIADGTLTRVAELSAVAGLDRPDGLAIADDGLHLYTAGFCDWNIGIFRREPSTGGLTWAGAAFADGQMGCPNSLDHAGAGAGVERAPEEGGRGPEDGPDGPEREPEGAVNAGAVAIAADGRLLVSTHFGNRTMWFERDGDTLTFAGMDDLRGLYFDFAYGGFGDKLVDGWPDTLKGWSRLARAGDSLIASAYVTNTVTLLPAGDQLQHGAGGVARLAGAYNLDLSPDGKHVYVAARNHGEVASFTVGDDGSLTEIRWPSDQDNADSGALTNVTVSLPDGESVYAVDSQFAMVRQYDRDTTTGVLTPRAPMPLPLCGSRQPFPVDVVPSPDGKSVYVADFQLGGASCLYQLDRAPDGTLTPAAIYDDAVLEGVEAIAITRDGAYVYTAAHFAGKVTRWRRTLTGALEAPKDYAEKALNGAGGVAENALDGAEVVVLSPDEKTVYASSPVTNSLVVFNRLEENGELTHRQTLTEADGYALDDASGVAVHPNGLWVFIAARDSGAISVFSVEADGTLKHADTVKDPLALDWPNGLVMTPDGTHLLSVAVRSSALASWHMVQEDSDGCGGTCN